jgi:hypothetical protein
MCAICICAMEPKRAAAVARPPPMIKFTSCNAALSFLLRDFRYSGNLTGDGERIRALGWAESLGGEVEHCVMGVGDGVERAATDSPRFQLSSMNRVIEVCMVKVWST